jgi:hypothetical protein
MDEHFKLSTTTVCHQLEVISVTTHVDSFGRELRQHRSFGRDSSGLMTGLEQPQHIDEIAVSSNDSEARGRAVMTEGRAGRNAHFYYEGWGALVRCPGIKCKGHASVWRKGLDVRKKLLRSARTIFSPACGDASLLTFSK